MSTQASHHIYLWNLPSSCAFFSPSPSPPLSPFPPPRCPLPIFPPLPHCPSLHLLLTLSPLSIANLFPSLLLPSPSLPPRCSLPDSPSLYPPTPLPVAIHPSPSTLLLPVHPPHLPLPTPLPTFGPCQPLSIFFTIAPPHTGSYDH